MPKPRSAENKGLPSRWQHTHGAYYYRVPPGLEMLWDGKKRFWLGASLGAAYAAYAARIETPASVKTIGQLLDRYALEVVPTKKPKTAYDNLNAIKRLRKVFGTMPLTGIEPHHIYKYVTLRGKRTAAHREIEVLSHAFTKAVEWGEMKKHPFKGEIRLTGEKPRDRYVEDWEVTECLSLPPVRRRGSVASLQAYIRLKLLTGLRRGDMLRLRVSDCRDDGIHVTTSKTGQRVLYEWTPERRAAVDAALAARPVDLAPHLFCTKDGKGYMNEEKGTASTFNNMWQGFIGRVLKETKVTERFTEHDLRAKCASDAESLEKARKLLAHVDARMTARVYRRKPERV
jgi:integrase